MREHLRPMSRRKRLNYKQAVRSLLHHTEIDTIAISAWLHCQLPGRPTRPAVHISINILTVSSRFLIASVSCQHCASAVALTYLAICCCLFYLLLRSPWVRYTILHLA